MVIKNRWSTLVVTNALGWLKLARVALRAKEQPEVKPNTVIHTINRILFCDLSTVPRLKIMEFYVHILCMPLFTCSYYWRFQCKALKPLTTHTFLELQLFHGLPVTSLISGDSETISAQTFDRSVILTLGTHRTHWKVRIISWMVADDPYVVSIRVIVIWYLPHVWPEKGISLRCRPDAFVHLQKDQRVIRYCFYNCHLLDRCCNT
jgi:hypothetical protein